MARPRKVSDDEVYAAAMKVMSRVGPGELTLSQIAAEAGVTPGALVQRFGSRRELLVTMSGLLSSDMSQFFQQMRAEHDSPLDSIRAYAECMAAMAPNSTALMRNFAYLQADLADPDIRKHLVAQSHQVQRELTKLLDEAGARGELSRDTDVAGLARNIEALVSGALLTWAFHEQGSAASWLRAHVDALLRPHLRSSRKRIKQSTTAKPT
jgi:AcrR family transcriptional regulator